MDRRKVRNIIEALSRHQDPDSINVLNEVGTNSAIDEVREMTSRALVKKNVHDSLEVVITNKGKGINDLSTLVAMSTINRLWLLKINPKQSRFLKILLKCIRMKKSEITHAQ